MKKLRVKVFVTIFLILTIFTFSLLLLSNFREYTREKNSIEDLIKEIKKTNELIEKLDLKGV